MPCLSVMCYYVQSGMALDAYRHEEFPRLPVVEKRGHPIFLGCSALVANDRLGGSCRGLSGGGVQKVYNCFTKFLGHGVFHVSLGFRHFTFNLRPRLREIAHY